MNDELTGRALGFVGVGRHYDDCVVAECSYCATWPSARELSDVIEGLAVKCRILEGDVSRLSLYVGHLVETMKMALEVIENEKEGGAAKAATLLNEAVTQRVTDRRIVR